MAKGGFDIPQRRSMATTYPLSLRSLENSVPLLVKSREVVH